MANATTPDRRAAERTLDRVLADSFPASDPPSWTFGITRSESQRPLAPDDRPAMEGGRAETPTADAAGPATAPDRHPFLSGLAGLLGAAGVVLLVPVVVLVIGAPIALVIRGVVEVASRLLAMMVG
ncbi:MAG TPA: hypothetical protein VFO19_18355 [Vicinamibacterales bacterium]|nr:hypothetical protein [Vicinamibacterales bacterium]